MNICWFHLAIARLPIMLTSGPNCCVNLLKRRQITALHYSLITIQAVQLQMPVFSVQLYCFINFSPSLTLYEPTELELRFIYFFNFMNTINVCLRLSWILLFGWNDEQKVIKSSNNQLILLSIERGHFCTCQGIVGQGQNAVRSCK